MLRNISHATTAFERAVRPLTPAERIAVQDQRDTIRRRLWEAPVRQAVPMTAAHAKALWALDPTNIGLMALTCFAAGLRFSDATRIAGTDVTAHPSHIELRLRVTKTTTYQRRPQYVAVALPQAARLALIRRSASVQEAPMWTVTYPQFVRFLRRIDPSLTAHSPRRGFVHASLDAGIDDASIMRVTRHATMESFAAYAGRAPSTWVHQQLRATAAVTASLHQH